MWCLEADGSAMYTISALWTQAREGLDVTTIVFNNSAYAILRLELQQVGAAGFVVGDGARARSLLDLSRPDLDFVAIATGMGVPAVRVTTAEEMADALRRAAAESRAPTSSRRSSRRSCPDLPDGACRMERWCSALDGRNRATPPDRSAPLLVRPNGAARSMQPVVRPFGAAAGRFAAVRASDDPRRAVHRRTVAVRDAASFLCTGPCAPMCPRHTAVPTAEPQHLSSPLEA